ncbi:unnamed protein product [Sphagnum balticum]
MTNKIMTDEELYDAIAGAEEGWGGEGFIKEGKEVIAQYTAAIRQSERDEYKPLISCLAAWITDEVDDARLSTVFLNLLENLKSQPVEKGESHEYVQ